MSARVLLALSMAVTAVARRCDLACEKDLVPTAGRANDFSNPSAGHGWLAKLRCSLPWVPCKMHPAGHSFNPAGSDESSSTTLGGADTYNALSAVADGLLTESAIVPQACTLNSTTATIVGCTRTPLEHCSIARGIIHFPKIYAGAADADAMSQDESTEATIRFGMPPPTRTMRSTTDAAPACWAWLFHHATMPLSMALLWLAFGTLHTIVERRNVVRIQRNWRGTRARVRARKRARVSAAVRLQAASRRLLAENAFWKIKCAARAIQEAWYDLVEARDNVGEAMAATCIQRWARGRGVRYSGLWQHLAFEGSERAFAIVWQHYYNEYGYELGFFTIDFARYNAGRPYAIVFSWAAMLLLIFAQRRAVRLIQRVARGSFVRQEVRTWNWLHRGLQGAQLSSVIRFECVFGKLVDFNIVDASTGDWLDDRAMAKLKRKCGKKTKASSARQQKAQKERAELFSGQQAQVCGVKYFITGKNAVSPTTVRELLERADYANWLLLSAALRVALADGGHSSDGEDELIDDENFTPWGFARDDEP